MTTTISTEHSREVVFPPATDLDRKLALTKAREALRPQSPTDAFVTGEQFVMITAAMTTVHGGTLFNSGEITSQVDNPFANVRQIIFTHRGPSEVSQEGKAGITIVPNNPLEMTTEYVYGDHQMGEQLNGRQIEIHRHPTIHTERVSDEIDSTQPNLNLKQGLPFILHDMLSQS